MESVSKASFINSASQSSLDIRGRKNFTDNLTQKLYFLDEHADMKWLAQGDLVVELDPGMCTNVPSCLPPCKPYPAFREQFLRQNINFLARQFFIWLWNRGLYSLNIISWLFFFLVILGFFFPWSHLQTCNLMSTITLCSLREEILCGLTAKNQEHSSQHASARLDPRPTLLALLPLEFYCIFLWTLGVAQHWICVQWASAPASSFLFAPSLSRPEQASVLRCTRPYLAPIFHSKILLSNLWPKACPTSPRSSLTKSRKSQGPAFLPRSFFPGHLYK